MNSFPEPILQHKQSERFHWISTVSYKNARVIAFKKNKKITTQDKLINFIVF
jgi:hypothetical protein